MRILSWPLASGVLKICASSSPATRSSTLFAGTPKDKVNGPTASRTLTGLTMHLDAKGMKKLLDGIKPICIGGVCEDLAKTLRSPTSNHALDPIFGSGLPPQICAALNNGNQAPCGLLNPTDAGFVASLFQGDQTMDFVFGSVKVSSASSPPFDDTFLTPVITPAIPSLPFTPPTGAIGGGFTQTSPGQTQAGGPTFSTTPVGVVGVPFGLVAAAVLLALLGSTRLRLLPDRMLATRTVVRCPLEDSDL